jgi:outer membrane immunogenic protein
MRLKLAGFVAAVSLAATQSAFAADMPAKAPVYKAPMAAATPWTGFYVNGGIGYGMWAADTTDFNPAAGACGFCETQVQGGKGWLGTIGAGYDYQFAPKIVAGIFGEASISSLKGTIQDRAIPGQGEIKQTSSWAAGGRVGWLVTPQTLSYVNVGYTAARFSDANLGNFTSGAPSGFSTPGFTANGWFLGGGVETSLAPNWFWRTEYRYAYYGNKLIAESPAFLDINFKPTVQTVTSQIVYKFNGGMPAPVYPATPAVATNWTGLYVNAGAGYGVWNADTTQGIVGAGVCSICATQVMGGKGYLGVIGAGYDWQFAPAWLAGVFGDVDISSLKGTIQDQVFGNSGTIKQTSAWAVGPRLGWLPSPQTMTYVNGGYTGARFSGVNMVSMFDGAPTAFTTSSFTASGWFLGGGVETTFDFFGMLGKGWFWRTEYRYASYGNKTATDSSAGVPIVDIAFKPTVQTVTSQVVFKFN